MRYSTPHYARLRALCYLFFARLVLLVLFVRGALRASERIISQSDLPRGLFAVCYAILFHHGFRGLHWIPWIPPNLGSEIAPPAQLLLFFAPPPPWPDGTKFETNR